MEIHRNHLFKQINDVSIYKTVINLNFWGSFQ